MHPTRARIARHSIVHLYALPYTEFEGRFYQSQIAARMAICRHVMLFLFVHCRIVSDVHIYNACPRRFAGMYKQANLAKTQQCAPKHEGNMPHLNQSCDICIRMFISKFTRKTLKYSRPVHGNHVCTCHAKDLLEPASALRSRQASFFFFFLAARVGFAKALFMFLAFFFFSVGQLVMCLFESFATHVYKCSVGGLPVATTLPCFFIIRQGRMLLTNHGQELNTCGLFLPGDGLGPCSTDKAIPFEQWCVGRECDKRA